MHTPLVSVIVPTHNRADVLTKTLLSIINQTYKNFELIVISNGSTDHTKEAIESFKDSRIIFLEQPNSGGPASPRNNGVRHAKGEYIAFCDDDDLWAPDKLERQVSILEENTEYGLCYTQMIRFNEEREWFNPHEHGPATFYSLLYKNTVPISSIVMRKKIIEKVGCFNESSKLGPAADYEFILRVAYNYNLYYLEMPLINYYSSIGRTTKSDDELKIVDLIQHSRYLLNCFSRVKSFYKLGPLRFIFPIFSIYFNFLRRAVFILRTNYIKNLQSSRKV